MQRVRCLIEKSTVGDPALHVHGSSPRLRSRPATLVTWHFGWEAFIYPFCSCYIFFFL